MTTDQMALMQLMQGWNRASDKARQYFLSHKDDPQWNTVDARWLANAQAERNKN